MDEIDVEGKSVLLRVDYNIPLNESKVGDNYKLINSIPTIKYLLKNNCKIIIATHLGRPKGKVVNELKTDLLAKELARILKKKVIKLNGAIGEGVIRKVKKSKNNLFMLENLRFYKEEKENDLAFAHGLADLADVYINDAFAVCHRNHASVSAITKFLPCFGGLSLKNEIMQLRKALKPVRPAVWIFGGAKLNKLTLIEHALQKADNILIGGALVFSFLKAKGIPVGMSKIDTDSVRWARKLLKHKFRNKIILANDFLVAEKWSSRAKSELVENILQQQIGLDLGPKSIDLFKKYLRGAKTIVWNGPLGYYEWNQFAVSTKAIGRFIGKLTAATICGGGETTEALRKFNLQHDITHLSAGGGATLAFLAGDKLPGLSALINKNK